MYFSTVGTAILAAFGSVGAAPAARSQGTPIGEPVISPVVSPVPSTHDKLSVANNAPVVNETQIPPTLTYLFSANLKLGVAQRPISEVDGIREAQSLTGRLEGPALNATITAGIATPKLMNNGTVATVDNTIYGVTDDNYTVFATQVGIGLNAVQNSYVQLEVGGPYAYLSNLFIIARIARDDATRSVRLDGYKVV